MTQEQDDQKKRVRQPYQRPTLTYLGSAADLVAGSGAALVSAIPPRRPPLLVKLGLATDEETEGPTRHRA